MGELLFLKLKVILGGWLWQLLFLAAVFALSLAYALFSWVASLFKGGEK